MATMVSGLSKKRFTHQAVLWQLTLIGCLYLFFPAKLLAQNPIEVFSLSPLDFGSVLAGFNEDVVVGPNDLGAAIFLIKGEPNTQVTVSIPQNRVFVYLTTNPKKKIRIKNFKFGGGVNAQGVGTIDGSGQLHNVRLGGKAKVKRKKPAGNYSGTAIFRVLYL